MTRLSVHGFSHFPAPAHSRLLNVKMKTPDTKNPPGCADFVSRSSVYKEYLAEREEILRHKWIESEKVGRDIGFEQALQDWVRNHRDKWRANRRTPAPMAALNQSN